MGNDCTKHILSIVSLAQEVLFSSFPAILFSTPLEKMSGKILRFEETVKLNRIS